MPNFIHYANKTRTDIASSCLGLLSKCYVSLARAIFSPQAAGRVDAEARRILVLQLYDTLGDVVYTSPFYRELAASFPEAEITVAVSADGIPGLMEQNPYISDVIRVNTRCRRWLRPIVLPWRHWRLARTILRQRSFDVAIIPRYTIDFCYATLLAYFSGASTRIGYTEKTSRRKSIVNRGFDRLLTTVLPPLPAVTNEVPAILNVLSALNKKPKSDHTEMWITSEDRVFAARALERARTRRVCISPTSGHSELKQWGAARFAELAADLASNGCSIVLVGGAKDIALAEVVERQCADACINLVGQNTVRQMAAVVSMCDLFVGNDAGPAHAASAVGVPTLTIFGSSCHHQFAPWGKRNRVITRELACSPCRTGHEIDRCTRCIYDSPRCLESITVDEVLDTARSMLDEAGVPRFEADELPAGTCARNGTRAAAD